MINNSKSEINNHYRISKLSNSDLNHVNHIGLESNNVEIQLQMYVFDS